MRHCYLACLGFALVLSGCTRETVPWVAAEKRDVVSVLSTNGRVQPIETRSLTAETSGRVVDVRVKTGQDVKAGAVIATVDDREAQSTLQQAVARLAGAEAELKSLLKGMSAVEKLELKNRLASLRKMLDTTGLEARVLERLTKAGAVARSELTVLRTRLADLEAERAMVEEKLAARPEAEAVEQATSVVNEAKAALRAARARAGSSAIRAPIAGRVYSLGVEPNAFVTPGSIVGELGRLDRVRVEIYVDEPELGRVKEGQEITLRAEAVPGRTWQGVVENLPSAIEQEGSRRTGTLLAEFDNSDLALLPNLTVDVEIVAGRAADAVTVPRAAMQGLDESAFVWMVDEGGTVRRQPVRAGLHGAAHVAVLDGLAAGDVVLLPATQLTEGQRVTLAAASGK